MHIITLASFDADVIWHLPEVEWHDASVHLRTLLTPAGTPIVSWQIDTTVDGQGFSPSWSSGRRRSLPRHARVRVARHDGHRIVAVRIVDARGRAFVSTFVQQPAFA